MRKIYLIKLNNTKFYKIFSCSEKSMEKEMIWYVGYGDYKILFTCDYKPEKRISVLKKKIKDAKLGIFIQFSLLIPNVLPDQDAIDKIIDILAE